MKKRNKIIYWIATIWLSLGMTATGIVQLIKMDKEVENFTQLGYPGYLLTMLGIWKILGVVAVLMPRMPLLKEWAYAGFFFAMSGAVISHVIMGHGAQEIFGLPYYWSLLWYPGISDPRIEESWHLIRRQIQQLMYI